MPNIYGVAVEIIRTEAVPLLTKTQKDAGYDSSILGEIISRHEKSFLLIVNTLFEEYLKETGQVIDRFGISFEGAPVKEGKSILNVRLSKNISDDEKLPVTIIIEETQC